MFCRLNSIESTVATQPNAEGAPSICAARPAYRRILTWPIPWGNDCMSQDNVQTNLGRNLLVCRADNARASSTTPPMIRSGSPRWVALAYLAYNNAHPVSLISRDRSDHW
jgi:hypothetical protein